ncbi:MAG: hypothetical protein IAG10_15315 [Planctomycetaceae bacterium]|nr:hypothetical protein [Planctomycetaceae bacterium]
MAEGEDQKQWSKRYTWAKCREPYKTELDALASLWIEGTLSNEELALELWQFRDTLQASEAPSKTLAGTTLPDVHSDLEILVGAMISASLYPSTTEQERRALLEHSRNMQSEQQGNSR